MKRNYNPEALPLLFIYGNRNFCHFHKNDLNVFENFLGLTEINVRAKEIFIIKAKLERKISRVMNANYK